MKAPNIILIIIDAARRDHFSCYGYDKHTSPFIDDLTKESIFFENAYSTAAWTVPAHASLFTGLYPSEHRAQNNNLYLSESIPTLAEILRANGYITIGFSNNMYVGRMTGLERGFDHFDEVWRRYRHRSQLDMLRVGLKRLLHMTDRGAAETTDLIINWIKNRTKDAPFFMFVNYIDVHQVCHPPKEFLQRFPGSKYSYWRMIKFMRAYLNGRVNFYTGRIKFSEKDWENFKWIYDVSLYYVDYQISKIYECLRQQKLLDNTIFIITSDHGTNLGDHGLLHHEYCLYETLLRIPLIIRYKPLADYRRISQNIQLSDLFYIILELVDIKTKLYKTGRVSIYKLVKGEDFNLPVFAEWLSPKETLKRLSKMAPNFDFSKFDRDLKSIKMGRFKYIESSDGSHELYDLEIDPSESHNLYERKLNKAKELQKVLKEFTSHLIKHEKFTYKKLEMDKEVMRRLRSLGYVV